jgi:colanic acid/amylovoran biosynthesis glycosyltransferase
MGTNAHHLRRRSDEEPLTAIEASHHRSRVARPRLAAGELLLVIPSVVLMDEGELKVEEDFFNNLNLYCKTFGRVVFTCPALSAQQNEGYIQRSVPITDLPTNARYVQLPYTYREDTHFRHYFKTKRLLRELIDRADFLLFAPHAPFDWPTVAAREAMKRGRNYDMEYTVDYNELMRFKIASMPWGLKKLRTAIYAYWMKREAYRLFSRSALALLQGQEVFEAYKNAAPNPQTMLNVQVRSDDIISEERLEKKLAEIRSGEPIKLVYAGRMNDRKGALDWVKAIKASGCAVSATWFGDGPEHAAMERLAEGRQINLPGVVPREQLLPALRDAHVFMFCHKVPESPRCLIEALASGAPLVGYQSSYPEGLVAEEGGGEFVPMGDWRALGHLIAQLDEDRAHLADLVLAAASSGHKFDHDSAVQHRADLIMKYAGRSSAHSHQ